MIKVRFSDVEEVNSITSKCKVKICFPTSEEGIKKFVLRKPIYEKALNQFEGGIPIVGYYDGEEWLGHEGDIVGGSKISPKSQAFGFVSQTEAPWWEIEEDKEWLCAYAYLWTKRFPELREVIDKGLGQSMEISMPDGSMEGECFVPSAIVFDGLCILGERVTPAFEGSKFESFSSQYTEMKKEIECSFSGSPINIEENKKKEAKALLNKISQAMSTNEQFAKQCAYAIDEEKKVVYAMNDKGQSFAIKYDISEDESFSFSDVTEEDFAGDSPVAKYAMENLRKFAEMEAKYAEKPQEKEEEDEEEDDEAKAEMSKIKEENEVLKASLQKYEEKEKEAKMSDILKQECYSIIPQEQKETLVKENMNLSEEDFTAKIDATAFSLLKNQSNEINKPKVNEMFSHRGEDDKKEKKTFSSAIEELMAN